MRSFCGKTSQLKKQESLRVKMFVISLPWGSTSARHSSSPTLTTLHTCTPSSSRSKNKSPPALHEEYLGSMKVRTLGSGRSLPSRPHRPSQGWFNCDECEY